MSQNDIDNSEQLAQISAQLETLNTHRFVRAHRSWLGLILYNVVRGLAFGLGSVIGATVLVALLVRLLGHVDFVPIIGDWAAQIIDAINQQ